MPDKIQDKRKRLYDALVAADYDAGADFNDFNNLMDTDEVARQWVYDTAKSEGWKVGDNFEQFVGYITPAQESPTPQAKNEPYEFGKPVYSQAPNNVEGDIYKHGDSYTRTEIPYRTVEYPTLGEAQEAEKAKQREDALAAYRSAYNRLEAPGEVDEKTLIEWGNNMENAPIEQKNLYTRIMGQDATNRVDLDAVMRSYDETRKSLEGVEDPEGLAAYLMMPAEQKAKLPEDERNRYEGLVKDKKKTDAVDDVNELHERISSLMEQQRVSDIKMHRDYLENRSTGQAIKDAILGIPVAEAPQLQGVIPSSGLDLTPEGKLSNEQNAALTAAGRRWNEMKYLINAAQNGNLFDGLDKALGSIDTWTSDQMLRDNMAIMRVANKFDEEGEKSLTDNERALLDALALNVAVSEMYGDEISNWYKGGEMLGEMAPFMLEMLMNPLAGLGKKAADKVTRKAIEKYGKELVKKNAKKFALTRGAAKLGASVAGATGMALTTGLPAVGADIQKRMLGDATYGYDNEGNIEYTGHVGGEGLGTSAYKAVTSRMLDNVSEMLGAEYANLPLKWLQKAGKGTKLLGWIDNLANSKFGKGVSRFAEKTKWNGPIEEFLEEVHVGLINPLLVGDQSWEEFFTKDNLATIAIGVAVPGAAISTANTIAGAADGAFKVGAQERWKMQNAEAMGYQLWQDNPNEWNDLTRSLMGGQMEDVEKVLKEVYNNPKLTPEQKKVALEYAVYSLQWRTAQGVKEAFNEGKKFIDPMLRDIYSTAYAEKVSPVQANNAYKAMAEAEKNAQRVLGIGEESVDEWLNGRSAEEATNDAAQQEAIKAYQAAKLDFEGRRDRYIAEKERAYMESDRSIQANDNNGMVYATQLKDEPVYITGGNVVLNEDGTINVDNSSEVLYVKFPDDHVEMTSPDKFTEVFTSDRTADFKAAKRAEIDAKWKAEFDAAEAQSVEQEKRDSGVVFNMTDAQGEHRIEILNEGEKMSDILLDGAQMEIPTEELNRWKQEAGIQSAENGVQSADAVELPDVPDFFRLNGTNYEVASRNDDGSVDVMVDGKRETLPAGTDYSTHMPTDKKGEVQYEQMPVERTHEYFVQKVKDDEARAEMIEKRRKKAEAERKKFDKEPDPGIDPDAYEAKMTQWEADKKAAQAKVDYWNEVAKREAEITRSETREAVENIKPDVMEETADEFIANQLAGIKITPESFKRETGLSNAEQARLVGVISNDGVSVERAAEIMLENYDSELAGMGFTGDVQDVRDIIISVLSQGNPRSYAKKGREAREAENMDQQRADAEAWARGAFDMTLEELYLYEETLLPRIIRDYEGFDENEYYSNLAENNGYDTTRESESIGRGGELLQGEQPVPAGGTPVVGQRNEGGAVSDDVQGGGQNGVAQEEVPVNEPVGNSEQLISTEIPNDQSVAEGNAPGQSGVYADNQGNPVDADGKLIVDEVNSIDEITDEDFETPARNVQLPAIPENVANAIGTNGRPVVIKKNVFEKNGNTHVELEPEDSRNILRSALYNPNLVGSTQPIRRPDYKVAIRTGEQNAVVVLDVYQEKDFVEIVGWRMVNEKGLAKMQRQAEREGGQFLILSPNDGSAAALSALPLGLSSASEDINSVSNSQENAEKSGEIAENGGERMYSQEELAETKEQLGELNATSAPDFAVRLFSIRPWGALEEANAALKELLASYGGTLNGQTLAVIPFLDEAQRLISGNNKNQETAFHETLLDNGDKKITGLNSRGEVATVTIERDGKVVSVDSYDEGVLFEHTEYDGNGKATSVTRYDKQGNVVGMQVYEDGKAVPSGKQKTESGKQNGKQKAKTPMQKLADQVLDRAEEKRRIPLRERARELEAQVGVKANIIESLDEVKNREARERIAAGEPVAGWYSGGQVYLYMPNIKDKREIELTYVHEVVAHHGVKKLLGERFNEFLDGVWNMMSEADRARMLAYVGANENPTLQDMRAAADEYVAELAEEMNLGELEQSTWEKIVDWFKKILENIGFENLTKEDIESMLKASYSNLKAESGKGKTGSTENAKQTKAEKYRKMREDLEGLGVFGEVALPKGYKWSDGKKYGGKGGRRGDSSSITALVIGDDLYLRDNQKMGGIVPFVNLNNKNHQTAVIRNFRQWPSIGDFMTAVLDVGYQFDRVTEDAINEIFTQNGIGFNRSILRPMFRIAEVQAIEEADKVFNEELDAFKENSHKGLLHLGSPMRILLSAGVNAEELTLSPTVLFKHLKKQGLTTDDLKGLAKAIQTPILVYEHGENYPNIVVVTELDVKGGKLSIALELDDSGNVVEVSNVSSVHSKDAVKELERLSVLDEETLNRNLRWVEKEKVSEWLGLPYEEERQDANPKLISVANVINNFENPTVESENSSENPQDAESGIRFRKVEDPAKIAELEAGEKIKTYRAMALIDGKLYPPMSSKSEGVLREPSEIGVWEEAEENPGKAKEKNGKYYFTLTKDNGKSVRDVAYNPYLHSSTTMLNDQFKEAQSRDNLVVVEMEIPTSELTSGYKADKAHDTVGTKDWKAGTIQGQLTGTREVVLSRWGKPVRIVPVEEVAENIKTLIEGQVEYMPTNVVTPQQRKALEDLGVKFVETNNNEIIQEGKYKGEQYSSVYGKKAKRKASKPMTKEEARQMVRELVVPFAKELREEQETRFKKRDSERRQEKRRINDIIDTAAGFVTVGGKKQATKNRLKKEAERKQLAKEMYSSVLKGDFNDVTLSQIDKFIEDATPANPFGRRISQRLPQRMERALRQGARTNAVDALFSRICESTVPANERFSEAGRREIEERKKELLKGWAIATGNWHTDLKEFTDDTEPIGEGKDSKVYMSKDGNSVIKASKGKPFGKKFRPDIDNIPLFNDVFKNSRYEILGYGEIDGQFVRILKQDFIDFAESTPLTPEERKEYMGKLGFKPLNKDYTAFSNGEIVIADLQKSNIVKDAAGNISVIDADAKLHTKDVGGDYTYPPVEEDLPEQETRFRKVGNTENNSIFASTYKTEDGKDINYTSERTEGYGVQDDGIGNSNNGSRRSILQRQTDTGVPGADSGLDVEKGEFCVVERVFTENGAFNFTSGEKIESADDVAYIFSALEDAAKEHSFVVYVKDGMPTVVELGMGSFNATMVDVPTASLAYSRINPDHVYFVHNHPSGNLICSSQDVAMLRVFEDMSDVPVTGVIINLKTGKYGTFDTERHSVIGEKRVPEKEERLAVHTLDKQIFAPDYDPMAQPLVRGSQDVAQFLNSQRMGDRPKVSFLILSRANRIIGNIHTPFTNITTDVEAVARYINERVIQFGGENAILYGDFAITSVEGMDFRLLQNAMDRFGKTKLLDVVRVEGNFTRSANDMGLLYEPEAEYKEGQTMFRITDTDRQALEFKRQHKGSANIVAIDTDALVAELLAQGFTAEEIPEIRKMHEKGVLGFYDRKRNTIYLLGKDHGEKENNATFWHENTHKAIGELDVPQEIMDEFYAMPSERFIEFFEGKAKEFYEPEEYAEELIAYFVEEAKKDGDNFDDAAKTMETSAENMERLKEIVEPIISYINHGRRVNEGAEGNDRTVVRETIGNGDVETLSEGARTEAEGEGTGETRFRTVEETTDGSIDDIQTQPLTLMERITNSLLEVSAKNKENLELRASALRTFGRGINRVLSLMKAQREYDKSTVDTLVKLAKMYFQNAQLLGEVTPYEVARIMGVLNRSVGKRDISTEAAKLMDILLDAHANALAGILDKAEKVKAKKVNAAGVEVMGRLDKYGQKRVDEYRAAKGMTPEKLEEAIFDSDNRLAELEQRVREVLGIPDGDVDQAAREYTGDNNVVNVYMDERARFEGLTLAREYKEAIQQVQEEIKDLKRELKQAEEDYRLGNIDGKSLKEFRKSVAEAIMESKAELIEGYHSLIYKFQENTKESSQRAKAFAQAQIDRAREIQHNANSDMEGISAATQGKHPENYNNAVMNALRSPFPTLQGILKKFGEKNVEGKGYLYERFIPQATKAGDNEFRGKVAARVIIEGKLKEIYGKEMTIAKFMKSLREDGVTIEYREGNEMKQFDLTKGQMLYIYMVNKMSDGQMKLRRMGITDDVVAELMTKLPEEAVQFADWAQNELLKDLRGKYNAVHERVFGAPMAAIENYFPIKIRKEARGEKGDVSEVGQEGKPSTVTGSIIKRTKNATAIDLSADAMQVLMEHIDDMEHWAAFAEFNRDLNVLLNYKHFQNQVKNMTSVRYGSGTELWKNFKKTAQIVSGTYRPSDSSIDRAVQNIAKGLTRSKINFRLFTAIKQLLSAPAFWTDAGVEELAYCYANPKGSFDWAKENLPGFAERWQGRTMGNEKLLKSDSDWEVWRNEFVEKATRWGMTPNAAIDALTVAQGARAVYMTKLEQFKKAGYTEQRANEKALQAAAEAYNESQQSSEGMYLSPLQVEGTVASAIFSTFKNSNFGYTRKTAQAVANIKRKMRKGYKEETIAFMTKQMVRDGLSEENAKRFAEKVYYKSMYRDAANVAMFGFGLNLLWEAGGMAIYLLLGDDDEEKEKMMKEIALRGSLGLLNGVPFGETMISAAMAVKEGDTKYFRLPELVAVSDIKNLAQVLNYDPVRGANDIVNMLVSMGVGVTPQVLTDILVAFGDVEEFSAEELGMFVARFMNAPQSNLDRLMVDDAMENSAINADEIMRRYAEYKKSKNAPITQFLYPDAIEQKALERYMKRFNKMLDERLENVVEDNDAYDLFYKGADARMKSELAKMRQKYLAEDKAEAFEKMDAKELVERVLYGSGEINEAYFNLSTAEDEDDAFVLKSVLKELNDLVEEGMQTDEEEQLLGGLKATNNAINKAKRLMKQQPDKAQEHMNNIRKLRAEAMELINNYRKNL